MNSPRETPFLAEPATLPATLAAVTDDPRHIGQSIPREGARRLVQGRGQFVDDIELPRLLHEYLQKTRHHGDRQPEKLLIEQRRTNKLLQALVYAGLGFVLSLVVLQASMRLHF